MNRAELDFFRKLLLNRQRELQSVAETASDSAETVTLDQTRQGRLSRMDALQQQAMSQETNRRRQLELQRITSALQRMDNGDFGYCSDCGETIAYGRLEISPTVTKCITCAEKNILD